MYKFSSHLLVACIFNVLYRVSGKSCTKLRPPMGLEVGSNLS